MLGHHAASRAAHASLSALLPIRIPVVARLATSLRTVLVAASILTAIDPSLAYAKNPIQIENARPGSPSWVIADTQAATEHEIEGYASATSVNLRATIDFYVKTASPSYHVEFYRTGWYGGVGARQVQAPRAIDSNSPQPDCAPYGFPEPVLECHWKKSFDLQVPGDWVSGVYLAKLIADDTGKQSYIIFVVRGDESRSRFLVQSSVLTWQVYNYYGGVSGYGDAGPADRNRRVSFDRPYTFAAYPPESATPRRGRPLSAYGGGAGEYLATYQPDYSLGASASRASADPAGWEYNMVRWLEMEGYDVSYCTDIDTHANPHLLDHHNALLVVGHDEFWTWEMRQDVEAARDRGVNLGFFTGNSAWFQVRLEPSTTGLPDRVIRVDRFDQVRLSDPFLTDSDPNNDYRASTDFRNCDPTPPCICVPDGDPACREICVPVCKPEDTLLGVMFGDWPVNADFVVTNETHWAIRNQRPSPNSAPVRLDLRNGDHLHLLVGYETDQSGLGGGKKPPGLQVIARSPTFEGHAGDKWQPVGRICVSDADCRPRYDKCDALHHHCCNLNGYCREPASGPCSTNSDCPSYDWVCNDHVCQWPRGQFSEMTTYYTPSGVLVFATGSMQWVWGLDDYKAPGHRSEAAQQMTRNVLFELAKPWWYEQALEFRHLVYGNLIDLSNFPQRALQSILRPLNRMLARMDRLDTKFASVLASVGFPPSTTLPPGSGSGDERAKAQKLALRAIRPLDRFDNRVEAFAARGILPPNSVTQFTALANQTRFVMGTVLSTQETTLPVSAFTNLYQDTDPDTRDAASIAPVPVDTGPLCPGQQIKLEVTGCVVDYFGGCTGPDGTSPELFRDLRVYGLIGRWSSDPDVLDNSTSVGPAFFVGSNAALFAPAEPGLYYLFLAENDGIYVDNSGAYSVTAAWTSVSQCPTPPVASPPPWPPCSLDAAVAACGGTCDADLTCVFDSASSECICAPIRDVCELSDGFCGDGRCSAPQQVCLAGVEGCGCVAVLE